jgi:hypothetical protein
MGDRFRRALPALAVLLPAGLVFLVHALLFGDWIVDDAGISFAYARSLATGHGLVAQPGVPPVEGFSNPLWVLLLTPVIFLRLFDPVLTSKALALMLTAGSFFLLYRSLADLTGSRLAAALPPILLALDTSFVAWSVSGLENPLYAFLLVLLFRLLVRERQAGPSPRRALLAGAAAAGIALTRPDGVVFCILYPLLTPCVDRWQRALGRIAAYAATFAGLFGGYLAFRFLYFGDLVPNTYHAKGTPMGVILTALLTLGPDMRELIADLLHSVAGQAGVPLTSALMAGCAVLAVRRRFRWLHGALLAFLMVSALPFLLLPYDWMGEYRFATPFHLFFFPWAVSVVHSLGTMLAERFLLAPERRRLTVAAAVLLIVGWGLSVFFPRSILFAATPTVPFAEVEEEFGRRYNHFADLLGLRSGSILLPDVGGTLWVSRLRVYDLAGLIDPTIARTREADHRAFYEYVFATVKPTFIHTHHYWTLHSGLDLDPRLQRDYLPLHQRIEQWVVESAGGVPLRSGDYVRRDVAAGHEDAIRNIRQELIDYYASRGMHAVSGPQGPAPGPLR